MTRTATATASTRHSSSAQSVKAKAIRKPASKKAAKSPEAPATPRTQLARRAEAEARLLSTARRLIARRGWEGTTLADVGEEAGYSRGLAAHYFGSKAGLLRAITEQINNSMMQEVLDAPAAKAGLGAILAFVGVYLGRKDPTWTNTRSLLNLMTHALLEGSEHADLMVNFNMSMFKYVEDNIRAGIAKGEIDAGVSPSIGAEFVIGTLRGTMLQRLVKGGDIQAGTLSKHIQSLIKRSLRAS